MLSFQLDTGASCNIMPIDIATRVLGHRLNLQRPRRKLQLYDTSELQTLGTIAVKLTNPKTAHLYDLDFYITSSGNRTMPLIGAHDCLRMNLLCVNAHSIAALSEHDAPSPNGATSCVERASERTPDAPLTTDSVIARFADVFTGLDETRPSATAENTCRIARQSSSRTRQHAQRRRACSRRWANGLALSSCSGY